MKVTLYKSNDGKLHENKAACEKHNAMLAAAPAIKDSIHADHSLEGDSDVLSVDQICEWAVKNATQLVAILTPFVPTKPRVPRKPKAAAGTPAGADAGKSEGAAATGDAGAAAGDVIAKAMGTQPA
jgi:hypothetical protein